MQQKYKMDQKVRFISKGEIKEDTIIGVFGFGTHFEYMVKNSPELKLTEKDLL